MSRLRVIRRLVTIYIVPLSGIIPGWFIVTHVFIFRCPVIDPTLFSDYNGDMPIVSDRMKRQGFVIAGTISLLLGIIGIIIPILPTTPFLLLAAICYTRGSKRLYNAFLNNRFVGTYIRNYLEGKGMPLRMKIWTLALLWLVILCTAFCVTNNLIVRIILAVVLVGVTIHVLKIKTIRNNPRPLYRP